MGESLPRARRTGLVVQPALDELLIYDQRSRQAHCLSPVAAAVWSACDGRTPIEDLPVRAREATGAPCDGLTVWRALEELRERHLLDEAPSQPPAGWSRRDLVRVLATAAPLITSITAPTPALAQSPAPGPQGPQGPQGSQG